jgi:hypothetical protein
MPAASTPHDTVALAGNASQAGNPGQESAALAGNEADGRLAETGAAQAQTVDGQDAPPALLVAQLAPGATGPAVTDGAAVNSAQVVAVVKEGGGNARIVRNGQSLSVAPGEVILMGDSIDTEGGTVKIEFTRSSERGNGDKAMSVTIGAHSNLLIRAEAGEQQLLSLRMSAGAIAIENSPSQGEGISIDTPSGRVVARGQGVGVSVNSNSGETTVLPIGPRAAAGTQSDGVWVQSSSAGSAVGVSGEGTVLHAAAANTRAAEAPTAAQASVITSLVGVSGPAPDAGTGPAALGGAAAAVGTGAGSSAGAVAATGTAVPAPARRSSRPAVPASAAAPSPVALRWPPSPAARPRPPAWRPWPRRRCRRSM